MIQGTDQMMSPTWNWSRIGGYKYNQSDIIGYGFESTVYKGIHVLKKYQVAIKAVNTENLQAGMNKIHFDNQIKTLEILKCTPNILNLLEKIQKNHFVYLVTQLCQGDLSEQIEGGLSEQQAWNYMKQLVKGFIHLWKQNIVHRDIKPKNLFMNAKKQIKIGDFGFAVKEEELEKQKSYNVGSPAYMSPEAFKYNQYSHSSDIWAIGVIFYQMLTGQLPWKSKTEEQLEKRLNSKFITKFINLGKFSQKAKDLLARMLKVEPEDRIGGEQLIQFFNQKKKEDFALLKKTHTNSHIIDDEESNITELSSPLWNFKKTKNKSKQEGGGFNLTLNPVMKVNNQTQNQKIQPKKKIETPPRRPQRRNSNQDMVIQNQQPMFDNDNGNKDVIYSPVVKGRRNTNTQKMSLKINKIKPNSQTNINLILTYVLELVHDAFEFFKQISDLPPAKWKEHILLLKVCYKNFIVKTITQIVNLKASSKLVSQFCSMQEIKKYLSDPEYQEIKLQCQLLIQQVKINKQISLHWEKAKENNFLGLLNATMSFLEALKPTLSNQMKDELKIGLCGAIVAKKIAKYLSSSVKQVKQEARSPSFSTVTKPKVDKLIEEAIKSRKQLFE